MIISFNRILTFLLFICFPGIFFSQTLKGKVFSEDGKQTVPFAVVVTDKSNRGTTTDIDGSFTITLNGTEKAITIQVIGYYTKTIEINTLSLKEINTIKLKNNDINLLEVVVTPKENPANILIKKVIANKPKYDIVNLKYYLCNTYAKTYFTLSDETGDEDFYNKDTTKNKNLRKALDKHYFFFMESVTEKKYIYKNKSQEKVLSSRISGFKSAPFSSFASQLQSFTFYNDNIELLGVKYVSPIIRGTLKRYKFEIIDTVYTDLDTTILIKFSPKKNASFKAMKGVLYINKNQYALCNVLAEPALTEKEGTGIKIQQLYEKVDSIHWFPKQVNTEILFNSIQLSNTDAGKSIMKGVTRMYVSDIKLDSVIKIKRKSVAVYNDKDFADKDEEFWKKHRVDSLNKKELKTYEFIDSIGKSQKFEQKLKWFSALTTGKFQIGYVNLDLKHFIRLNDYEGVRLGMGLSTSNKLSRWFSVGGFGAYGFRDKAWKYGGHAQINLNERQSTFLLGEAASDITESAGTSFLETNTSFISTQKIREIMISKMDKINYGKISFNSSIYSVKTSAYFQIQQRYSPFGYYHDANKTSIPPIQNFNLNEAGIQLKYWPKEKFIESLGQMLSAGSKWPILYLNIATGITDKIYDYTGSFNYNKVDFKIDHQLNFRIKGFVSYQLQAGKVFGNVPYSIQYNNKGSRADKYFLGAEKTFETMYLNEFISTEYASFFFAINFGKIFKPRKKFNPEFELVHNYGIGNLNNRTNLTNIELNDISKGYTEAGFRIKSLYRSNVSSFGIGAFYRYGNYAYESIQKNIAVKLVIGISL